VTFLRESSLLRSAVLGGVGTLLIASFLPIWIVWHINPREGVGYERSLWESAHDVCRSRVHDRDPDFPVVHSFDSFNLLVAAGAFGIGGGAGIIMYTARRRLRSLPS
jgi:hypothetical protein